MKRLIFLSLLIFCFGFSPSPHLKVLAAICTIPETADIGFTTYNADNALAGALAEGNVFATGTGGRLGKICIYIADVGADLPAVTLRIGASNNLATYLEEFSVVDWTGGEYCWDSVTNPAIPASTNYYWGAIEDANSAALGYNNSTTGGGFLYSSSAWTMNPAPNTSFQHYFKIFYCD